jgi:protocatechuate 3,4-dioxygenase beta subunit
MIGGLILALLVPPRALPAQGATARVDEIEAVLRLEAARAQQNAGQPVRATAARLLPVGTASISGTVVATDTGRPVRNVLVMLSGTAGPPRGDGNGGAIPRPAVYPALANDNISVSRSTTTDAQGRFTFDRLAAGRYSIQTTRDGYLRGGWGLKRVGGQPGSLLLAEGQRLSVSILLARGGVITGQVLDEDGEPVRSVQVQAWRSAIVNGKRQFRQTGNASTDDRGMYRLFGLEPGDYRVAAVPRYTAQAAEVRGRVDNELIDAAIARGAVTAGAAPGYPSYVTAPAVAAAAPPPSTFVPVYSPSTTVADEAATIRVEANMEQGPFAIHLQYVPSATIHGIASPVPPGTQVRVALMSLTGLANIVTSAVNQGGEFTLRNVAPGHYRVLAQTTVVRPVTVDGLTINANATGNGGAAPALWGSQEVDVNGQDVQIGLALRPARTISGVVVSETTSTPMQGRQAQMVSAAGVPNVFGGSNLAPIDAYGHFTFTNVPPGSYTLRVPGTMKSSIIEGEDTLDFPFEFTGDHDVTDAVVTLMEPAKRTDLWGQITDASGKPVSDVTVVVAPIDERFWLPNARRIVMMRSDPWGRFKTQTLPPGSYYVATVGELESGGQYEGELLRSIAASGARVTLTESGSTRQDFRVR